LVKQSSFDNGAVAEKAALVTIGADEVHKAHVQGKLDSGIATELGIAMHKDSKD